MKRLLFLFLLPVLAFAQDPSKTPIQVRHDAIYCDFPSLDGKITYIFKDSLPGRTKSQLFLQSKTWLTSNFKDMKDVIQFEDKEEGTIVSKWNTSFDWSNGLSTTKMYVYRQMKVQVKDGKYRVTLSDFNVKGMTSGDYPTEINQPLEAYANAVNGKKPNKRFACDVEADTRRTIMLIQEYMRKTQTGNDDKW